MKIKLRTLHLSSVLVLMRSNNAVRLAHPIVALHGCSVGRRPVGAPGLTWTDCPGRRASTQEKRFMAAACGQVIASPSF